MEKPFVLVAEDNEATRTLIAALLQREFTLDAAGDGAEAIEKLKIRHYAAVLLDLVMPGTDGYAVLDFLAAERPALMSRVIVLTAAISPQHLDRVRQYPVCGVIAKPFEVETLQAAVRACCGEGEGQSPRGAYISGGVIFLIADLLRANLMR